MALRVVTGRANAGKTGVMYDVVREAAARGTPPVLLLPTRPDVARATAELSKRHPIGVRVEQLDDWIAELWALFGDGRRPVEPEQRALAVRGAVAEARLRALESSSRTPGFARLVSRLARYAAEEPGESLDGAQPRNAADREVVALLRSYRAALDAAGLVEPAETARLLAIAPPRVGGPVVVHRFSDLTASQEALLTALAVDEEVWISLPWERDCPATEALDALVGRLVAGAEHRHLDARGGEGDPELARLEAGLFRKPCPEPPAGAVEFCTAAGAEAEAALIAAKAAEAASRFGGDRVAVVFRDASLHVDRVGLALAGAGVQADIDVLVSVSRTPLGAALQRLVGFSLGRDGASSLLAYLRSPFSGADPDRVDELDAKWRSHPGLSDGRAASDAARIGRGPGRALKLARQVAASSAPDPSTWQDLADALLGEAHDARSLREDPEAIIDAAAHRAVLETVSRLAAEPRARIACADVLAALDDARVPTGPAERPGHVQVTEAHRLRGRRFDAVIVGGLTSGDFSSEGRSSAAADIAGRLLGSGRPSEQAVERLLFYTVCTRARRLLVLTRQTADSDGEAVRPSVLWEEALDLYREPDADAGRDAEDRIVVETVRLADLEKAAPALSPGRAALRAQAAASEQHRAMSAGPPRRPAPRLGQLRDPDTLSWLASREEFSATELETYARCPYRWFYERAVRPEGLDVGLDARSRGDLAHRALAQFYGDLRTRLGTGRVTSESLAAALELADDAFDRAAADAATPGATTLVEQDDLARVRSWVRSLVAEDACFLPEFEPRHLELRFGTAPAVPADEATSPDALSPRESRDPGAAPCAPSVDLGELRLCGSVDRVDVGRAGLVVIDYKTGAAPRLVDVEGERRIQVPLYAVAVRELLGEPVVAGLYRSLKNGRARGFYRGDLLPSAAGLTATDAVGSDADVDGILAFAVETARRAGEGIRAGAIPAEPAVPSSCRYCGAAGFCGKKA